MFSQGFKIILVILCLLIVPSIVEAEQVLIPRTEEELVCPKPENNKICSGKPEACTTGISVTLPTATPSPTKTPTPTSIISKQEEAENQVISENSGTTHSDSTEADEIFALINAHRAAIGLPAYEKDVKLCDIANSRIPELHNEIFGDGYIHQGFQERNIPFWITENMVGMGSVAANFQWWMNSNLHRQAIESSDFKYSCGACTNGICAQLFTSWIPK